MPLELHCRFDAEHGPFNSPITLQQHYQREHADVYVQHTKPCPECGVTVSMKNLNRHRATAHGVGRGVGRGRKRQPVPGERLRCDLCGHDYGGTESARKHFERKHPDVPYEAGAHVTRIIVPGKAVDTVASNGNGHAPEPHPWHVDDIVMPVVGQLAEPSAMIPVAVLAAIFAWRDATSTMLASVTTSARG